MANKSVTVAPSGGTYTSLAAAIAGEVTANADLTAAGMDGILTITIQGTWSSVDSGQVNVNGFTVDSTHYVNILTDSANQAGNSWDASKYRLSYNASGFALTLTNRYTRITGLQVSNTSVSNGSCIAVYGNYGLVYRCFTGNNTGMAINVENSSNVVVANCIAISGAFRAIDSANSAAVVYFYNVTALNSSGQGIRVASDTVLRNCYSGGNVGADYQNNASVWDHCFSEDGTGTTTTAACSTSSGAYFTNVTAGSEDLTLQSSSSLINAGADLHADGVFPFNIDLQGDSRPDGAWDVGADEYVAPVTGGHPTMKRFGAVPFVSNRLGVW